MKMTIFDYLILGAIFVLGSSTAQSQITISPEVGVSYLPFTVYGANSMASSNRLDYLIGLSGAFNIHKKWYIETRMSYSQREDVRWMDLCTCPGYLYDELVHSDLNLDLGFNYKLTKVMHFGMGFMAIRKINSYIGYKQISEDNFRSIKGFEKGYFLAASLNLNYVKLKLEYGRKIPIGIHLGQSSGGRRYNFVLAFPIKSQRGS